VHRHVGRDAQAENAMSAPDQDGIKETVRRFILSSITITDLDDDADLFDSGIVNSLFAVQLMTFVEKTFGIDVGMDDLDMANFKSLNATTAFVLKKNGRRGG
jgi:acyl carrier protein